MESKFNKAPNGLYVNPELAQQMRAIEQQATRALAEQTGNFIKESIARLLPDDLVALIDKCSGNPQFFGHTQQMLNMIGFRVQKNTNPTVGMEIKTYKARRTNNEHDILIGEFTAKLDSDKNQFVCNQKLIPATNPFRIAATHPTVRQWLRKIKQFAPEAEAILARPLETVDDAGGTMELGDTVGIRLTKGDSKVGEQQQPESGGGQRDVEGTLPVSGENLEPRNETSEETKPSDGPV